MQMRKVPNFFLYIYKCVCSSAVLNIILSRTINSVANPFSRQYFFVLKMLSAYYICCIYLNALETTFIMEANTINPDQTAPRADWSNLGP